jgi:acyl-CoA reductase-like NAD-dependent aldehyde dehydrogenase
MNGHDLEGLVDHTAIDRAFRALLEAFKATPPDEVAVLFRALAQRLRAHIDREELDISRFASSRPDDARALIAEHMVFRDALDALALRAEAGTLTESGVNTLKLSFSLHESREETGLYRWLREPHETSA